MAHNLYLLITLMCEEFPYLMVTFEGEICGNVVARRDKVGRDFTQLLHRFTQFKVDQTILILNILDLSPLVSL